MFKGFDEKKQERYDYVISTYNVFEGIEFKVIFQWLFIIISENLTNFNRFYIKFIHEKIKIF